MTELRQLRYFAEVARQGSFTAAAGTLNVSQPALGLQIAKLEAELCVKLFVRHSRGVTLTEEGARYFDDISDILARLHTANDTIRRGQTHLNGCVRVGILPSLGPLLTSAILKSARVKAPQVSVVFTEDFSEKLNGLLQSGALDIVLSYIPASGDGYTSTPLFSERLVLMGARRFLNPLADPTTLRDALDLPLAVDRHSAALKVIQRLGVAAPTIVQTSSNTARRSMLKQAEACIIGPLAFAQDMVENGDVVLRQIHNPSILVTLSLNARKPAHMSRRERLLQTIIMNVVAPHVTTTRMGWVAPDARQTMPDDCIGLY